MSSQKTRDEGVLLIDQDIYKIFIQNEQNLFFKLFFIGRLIFSVGERRRGVGERRRGWGKGGEGWEKGEDYPLSSSSYIYKLSF